MTKQEIENLIIDLKNNLNYEGVAYMQLYSDIDGLGLLVQPMTEQGSCLKEELVQFQIIDKKTGSTTLDMKGLAEELSNYLVSSNKDFNGFKTIYVKDLGNESLLKNDKKRLVYTKRFIFYRE